MGASFSAERLLEWNRVLLYVINYRQPPSALLMLLLWKDAAPLPTHLYSKAWGFWKGNHKVFYFCRIGPNEISSWIVSNLGPGELLTRGRAVAARTTNVQAPENLFLTFLLFTGQVLHGPVCQQMLLSPSLPKSMVVWPGLWIITGWEWGGKEQWCWAASPSLLYSG